MFIRKSVKLLSTLLIVKIGIEIYTILYKDGSMRRTKDAEFDRFNVGDWYKVNLTHVDEHFGSKFTQLDFDLETKSFLDSSQELSSSLNWLLYCKLGTDLLKNFLTKTNLNGLLNRGSMFVFSKNQIANLLKQEIDEKKSKHRRIMLDLGAGDGLVTSQFAQFFDQIYVTETAFTMRWRLSRLDKISVLPDINSWANSDNTQRYNLISALNLLDRCQQPLQLLKQMRKKLLAGSTSEGGDSTSPGDEKQRSLLLLAVVFPFSQYVEFPDPNLATETIKLQSSSLSSQAQELFYQWLAPVGFRLLKWTRVPYLCQGDQRRSFYALHDVVYLLEPIEFESKGIN